MDGGSPTRRIDWAGSKSRCAPFRRRVLPIPSQPRAAATHGGAPTASELYFVSATSRIMAVAFAPGMPPTIGKPEELFEVQVPVHPNRFQFAGYGYDASPDGSRFLVNR